MDVFNGWERSRLEDETIMPPGFRFHPTDEELITYFLLKKVLDSNFSCAAISQVDLKALGASRFKVSDFTQALLTVN
ncbi:hypothetical protein F2Q68_00017692 [Brassica cretica]|uniref:NAC domain-containing protein n=1 Tax=Brassica cretica TaxID=69181 RepID=A0A8S9HAJ5_BRACR|nr:hypothetical protein F2Q68_00017692 [Brassica cretica]KAF3589732.1 hypothetical protein F2Q69_00031564 [Brassica cretica]